MNYNHNRHNDFVFGDVTYEYNVRAASCLQRINKPPVYGVDRIKGLTPAAKYVSNSLDRYKVVEPHMFAYNPMRINIGSIAYCKTNQKTGLVSPDYVVFGCNPKHLDSNYLYYYIKGPLWQKWTDAAGVGSVRVRIYYRELAKMPISLPPLKEQKAIASILGALDDKIELNRRMNETLEAMARALFQSWFVDFDPVRAKSQGRHPAGMDAATATHFPGTFQDSPLGLIPAGWRVCHIRDCCTNILNGGTPSRKESRFWDNGNIPWLTSGEVRQPIIIIPDSYITEEGLAASSAKWVSPLSTVVALYGATAGQISLISSRLTTNQAICAMVPKKKYEYFNYLCMRDSSNDLQNKAVGSAQQNISKGIVEETQVVVPTMLLLEIFSTLVRPLFDRWIANLTQSRTLATLRDTLLPKLLSGELSVSKAKALAEV
jgi:type I restriction enzyme, S subunit